MAVYPEITHPSELDNPDYKSFYTFHPDAFKPETPKIPVVERALQERLLPQKKREPTALEVEQQENKSYEIIKSSDNKSFNIVDAK